MRFEMIGERSLSFLAVTVVLASWTAPAPAQEEEPRPFSVYVSVSRELQSLSRASGSSGGTSNAGWSGSLSVRTDGHFGADLFVVGSPADDDAYDLAPRLRMAGGWVTVSFTSGVERKGDVYFGTGLTWLGIRGWPDFSGCRVRDGCFREGGASFDNGDFAAFVLGLGGWFMLRRVLFRTDARAVMGEGAGQPIFQLGLGVGARIF